MLATFQNYYLNRMRMHIIAVVRSTSMQSPEMPLE